MNEKGRMTALPCNVDCERFVLGSILLDDSHYVPVAGALQVGDFSLESHRRIWRRMEELHGRGDSIDSITIHNALMSHGESESVGGLSYIVTLTDGLPLVPNLSDYTRIVKDKALLREIIVASQAVQNRALLGEDSASEVLDCYRASAARLIEGSTATGARPISTAEILEQDGVDALLAPRRHGEVRLPWSRLDASLSGLSGGQIVVVLGETSRGKTSFALQAATAISQQARVLIWTMEMSPRSLFRRMVNQISGVPVSSRNASQMSFQERESHRNAVGKLMEHPIHFDAFSRSVAQLCASMRRVQATGRLGLIVVDYLQLIRSNSRDSRAQQVSENSRELKLAAMDFDVPIMVLSQVDRASVKGKDAKIGLHSGKESGDVENDADVQLAIQAPQLARDQDTAVEIEVQKQREGPCGFSIPMIFRPSSQTFQEQTDER